MCIQAFCTPSASGNRICIFAPERSSHANACFYILKKPSRCFALRALASLKRSSQIALLTLARMAFLFVSFCLSNVRPFIHASMKTSARLKGLFQQNTWQPPALPCRLQHSTIGRTDLHRRVRDGNGCALRTHRHQVNISKVTFPMSGSGLCLFKTILLYAYMKT